MSVSKWPTRTEKPRGDREASTAPRLPVFRRSRKPRCLTCSNGETRAESRRSLAWWCRRGKFTSSTRCGHSSSSCGEGVANAMKALIAAVLVSLTPISGAEGHHTHTFIYDTKRNIEISGVLIEVRWAHPHVSFIVESLSDVYDGVWQFEIMGNPTTLESIGRSENDYALGRVFTFTGWQAKDGSQRAFALSIEPASPE